MRVGLSLLLLAWLQNLYIPPWVAWHSEIFAFAAVLWGGGCLILARMGKSATFVELPSVVWPFALLILVVGIQTQSGQIAFGGDGFILASYLMLAILASSIGQYCGGLPSKGILGVRSTKSLLTQFAVMVLLGGVLSAAVAFAQVLDVWESLSWVSRMPLLRRPGGNLGQPNQLATLMLFSIGCLIYLFESRRLSYVAAMPIAVVLLSALAMTESRTGALGLFLLFLWWVAKHRRLSFALSIGSAVLWVAFFVCCYWFWPTAANFIQEGGWTGSAVTQVNTSAGTRLLVWPQLWEAVLQRPWFGWGLGGVSVAQNAVLHNYTESEPFTYAHNIILDLAIGVGLPLAALMVGSTILWVWRRTRAVNDLMGWYCLAFALPFAVHSMFEFPFAYAYFLAPAMFLIGVLEARQTPARVVRVPWLAATTGWVLVSAVMAWSVVEYIAIEEDFRVARFESMRIGHTPGDYERPRIYLLTQLDALLEAARIVPTPGMTPDRIELARKAAMRFPWTATQNRYALSLALNGNPEEAIRQLKVMRAMHGEKPYQSIKANWKDLAESKYPQLGQLTLP